MKVFDYPKSWIAFWLGVTALLGILFSSIANADLATVVLYHLLLEN